MFTPLIGVSECCRPVRVRVWVKVKVRIRVRVTVRIRGRVRVMIRVRVRVRVMVRVSVRVRVMVRVSVGMGVLCPTPYASYACTPPMRALWAVGMGVLGPRNWWWLRIQMHISMWICVRGCRYTYRYKCGYV